MDKNSEFLLNPMDKVMLVGERIQKYSGLSAFLITTEKLNIPVLESVLKNLEESETIFNYNVEVVDDKKIPIFIKNKPDTKNIDFKYFSEKRYDLSDIEQLYNNFINGEISSENGPLFRLHIYTLKNNSLVLFFAVSHVITDATGLLYIINNVFKMYNLAVENNGGNIPIPDNFKIKQRHFKSILKSATFKHKFKWFLETLNWLFKNRNKMSLQGDKDYKYGKNYNQRVLVLSNKKTDAVFRAAKKEKVTINTFLLSLAGYVLHKLNKENKIEKEIYVAVYPVDLRKQSKDYDDTIANVSSSLNLLFNPLECDDFKVLKESIKEKNQNYMDNLIYLLSWKLSIAQAKSAPLSKMIDAYKEVTNKLDPYKGFSISNLGNITNKLPDLKNFKIDSFVVSSINSIFINTYEDRLAISFPELNGNYKKDPRNEFYTEFIKAIFDIEKYVI